MSCVATIVMAYSFEIGFLIEIYGKGLVWMVTREMAGQIFVLPHHTRVVGVGKRPDSLLGRVLVGRPIRSMAKA